MSTIYTTMQRRGERQAVNFRSIEPETTLHGGDQLEPADTYPC